MPSRYLLENGTDKLLMEDGSSYYLLDEVEPVSGTAVATQAAATGAVASKETFEGTAAGEIAAGAGSASVVTIQDGGPSQNEIQQVTVVATGGTFRLAMTGFYEFDIEFPFDVPAADMRSAIGNVTDDWPDTTKDGGVYTLTFWNLTNIPQMTADGSNLAGGGPIASELTGKETFAATLAGTGAKATASLSGEEEIDGELAGTQAKATGAIVAKETLTGTIAGAQPPPSGEIEAAEVMSGTLAGSGAASGAALDGIVANPVSGEIDGTQAAQSAALTGTGGAEAVTTKRKGHRRPIIPPPKVRISGRLAGTGALPGSRLRGEFNDDDLVIEFLEAA